MCIICPFKGWHCDLGSHWIAEATCQWTTFHRRPATRGHHSTGDRKRLGALTGLGSSLDWQLPTLQSLGWFFASMDMAWGLMPSFLKWRCFSDWQVGWFRVLRNLMEFGSWRVTKGTEGYGLPFCRVKHLHHNSLSVQIDFEQSWWVAAI